ncbi:MAG TPA: ABC transporter ATP-binding protein [Thermoanaerobaculia bacterium]|nr:ABC transporter ATP-binding protein [Thermoanaerobaculia bacterium]
MRIRCEELSLRYETRNGELAALEDVSLELGATSFVCLVGPSGCGKSTLLKLLAGLIAPSAGRLTVKLEHDPERLPRALVFQDHCVFPWMTVLDNVVFGLEFRDLGRAEKRRAASEFIRQMGLEQFAASYPHELSVGMRQRVALARAFVARPQILLMDEPLAALDALSKLVLQEELVRMWNRHPTLIVYVTHDLAEAVLLGDRVLVLSGRPGRIALDVEVPHPRPRDLADRGRPEIVEIERRLWAALATDVRRSLEPGEAER